jgi:N-acetylglucosamine-6-phosphate deacetylase
MTTFTGRIVTPSGVVSGTLESDDAHISAITAAAISHEAPWIVPGFVDMHVHGGGGHSMTTGSADETRAAAAYHLTRGTTTLLASLVSSPFELMRKATTAYEPLVEADVIAGLHFEGPYLSRAMCGAQNPAYLRDPSLDELTDLLSIGSGLIRMVTIAPERPRALDAISMLVSHGTLVAVGHTDATYQQVADAIGAGATVGTHVFNGMRPPHHRAPGPVYALLAAPSVVCEFIADGVHMADDTLGFATTVVGSARAALITDAMAAAGMPDGAYELGGQAVTVSAGVARLATTIDGAESTIAGSTLTMDRAFVRAARVTGSVVEAATMASTTPARVLGLTDRGALAVGLRADFVLLDPGFEVISVVRGGERVA